MFKKKKITNQKTIKNIYQISILNNTSKIWKSLCYLYVACVQTIFKFLAFLSFFSKPKVIYLSLYNTKIIQLTLYIKLYTKAIILVYQIAESYKITLLLNIFDLKSFLF